MNAGVVFKLLHSVLTIVTISIYCGAILLDLRVGSLLEEEEEDDYTSCCAQKQK